MRPSQTAPGKAWLGNFDGADLPAATILLDSVRLVTLSRLREGLYSRLKELVGSGALGTPAVVFPERALKDFGLPVDRWKSAAAYRDFDPGSPVAVTPGSEAFVGMVLRDLLAVGESERQGSPWIAPSASLEEMRRHRCRSLVVVTDYMGTGNQILKFVQALGRNPTIRSWLSFQWIQIHVVAFAASPEAIRRVRKDKDISSASTVEAAPTGRGPASAGPAADASKREAAVRRYAIVVVIEAADAEEAWEATASGLGATRWETMPEVVYVGAPWQGIPLEADGLSTEQLGLGMCLADGPQRFLPLTVALTPAIRLRRRWTVRARAHPATSAEACPGFSRARRATRGRAPALGGSQPRRRHTMLLHCPHCSSPEVAPVPNRGGDLVCENCGARFQRRETLVIRAAAEAYAEDRSACTCDEIRGCPQCFQRADDMVGATVRDRLERTWLVSECDEKDGFPTVCGE